MYGWMDGLHTYKHTFTAYITYILCKIGKSVHFLVVSAKDIILFLRVLFLISDFSSYISYITKFKL